jgi:UDP-glucose 4-epimerase
VAKILTVGGAGYVGAHTAKAVASAGHQGVVFDSLINGHRVFVRWGPLIVGDVQEGPVLKAALATHRFDAVLHFAALAYVGQSVGNPSAYYDLNVHGTRTLLQAMREAGIHRIVFSSTCAVYGEPESLPITERAQLAPIQSLWLHQASLRMDDGRFRRGLWAEVGPVEIFERHRRRSRRRDRRGSFPGNPSDSAGD